jgi:two-component system CheB/CheR fusion protein
VAAAYFASAKLGLGLAVLAPQVSAVWPPTGLALAAVLLLGYRIWPAIAVGAFLANLTSQEPAATAAIIAAGNTLEALAGAWLLRRSGLRPELDRLRDVFALVLLAAAVSTTLSASLGVVGLGLGGVVPWNQAATLWSVWWLGDAMGALVVAPLLLVWATARPRLGWRRLGELAALLAVLVGVGVLVFSGVAVRTPDRALAYAVFPLVIWAALRFGQPGATLVTAATSLMAIGGTFRSGGPFAAAGPHEGLVLVQVYLAVVAATGLVLGAAIAERDRAERRRLEAARQAQLRLEEEIGLRRAIERSVPAGVAAVDLAGRQTYVNPAFTRLLGWSEEELLGAEPPFVYWPAEEREAIQAALDATLSGDERSFQLRFRRRDGERFDALVEIAPQLDGEGVGTGWVASITDISEQMRTARALRLGEQRYRSLVAASAQVVWKTTPEGEVAEPLPTWQAFTGQSPEETMGRGWLAMLHPDDRAATARVWQHSLATSTAHATEFRVRAADGGWRHVLGRAVPVLEEDGRLREWVGTLTDITERKQLELELRQRAEELVEADRSKDEFLAMLAHELRNPLAPIRNALHLLEAGGAVAAGGERLLATVERQVGHLGRLVDDLLDVSRITRRQIVLRREPLDLREVVGRAVEAVRPQMTAARRELSVELPEEALAVEGDDVRLEQVVANLLGNAVKYTDPGGGIRLALEREGEGAVLRVADDGVGMPADLLPRIFDLFAQGDHSLARSRGGLGIGLTLVRRIVELHGGTVEASSAGPGAGSELVVRLPLGHAAPAEVAPRRAWRASAASPLEVLVVDDHVDAAESLAEVLRLEGHAVRVAHDGPGALVAVGDRRPHAVLLDLGLPGMDGYEVARRIREDPGLDDVLLVALTGYGRDEDRSRSRESGFEHHLVKPVDLGTLHGVLAEAGARRAGLSRREQS